MGNEKEQYIIGITGHRHLPTEKHSTIAADVKAFYQEAIKNHGAESITILSSLAEGADMLCAKLALDAGMRLVVPLPMNTLDYRKDFSESVASEFDFFMSLADQVFIVQPEEPITENHQRGFHYRQAGIYVAKHCDILLAVWDGIERDTLDGAGTWETVKLARGMGKLIHCIKT